MRNIIRCLGVFLVLVMIFTACSAQTPSVDVAVKSSFISESVEDATVTEVSSLYDLFSAVVRGEIADTVHDISKVALSSGFSVHEEAGILLIQDASMPSDYVRVHPFLAEGVEKIGTLVLNHSQNGEDRQIVVKNISQENMEISTGIYPFVGNVVATMEEALEFLTADAQDDLVADVSGNMELYEKVFLPIAEGKLSHNMADFRSLVEERGYLLREGEGMFVVYYEPSGDDCYLYGDIMNAADDLPYLGIVMGIDENEKGAEVWFKNAMPTYQVDSHSYETISEVPSLDAVKAYFSEQ